MMNIHFCSEFKSSPVLLGAAARNKIRKTVCTIGFPSKLQKNSLLSQQKKNTEKFAGQKKLT